MQVGSVFQVSIILRQCWPPHGRTCFWKKQLLAFRVTTFSRISTLKTNPLSSLHHLCGLGLVFCPRVEDVELGVGVRKPASVVVSVTTNQRTNERSLLLWFIIILFNHFWFFYFLFRGNKYNKTTTNEPTNDRPNDRSLLFILGAKCTKTTKWYPWMQIP